MDELSRVDPEERDPRLALEPAHAAGEPKHRRRLDTGQAAEARERRGILHRDQPPQVFADDVVERDPVRRLVALAAGECRAVALGEQGQAEADDEKGRGRDRVAGIAGERERGDPQPERTAAREPLDEPERRAQQPGDEDGHGERDQRRQQQRQVSLAVSARDLEHDERRRGDCGRIEQPEPRPRPPRRDDPDEHGGRSCRDDDCEHEPLARENAAEEHVRHRRAGTLGHDGAAE